MFYKVSVNCLFVDESMILISIGVGYAEESGYISMHDSSLINCLDGLANLSCVNHHNRNNIMLGGPFLFLYPPSPKCYACALSTLLSLTYPLSVEVSLKVSETQGKFLWQ